MVFKASVQKINFQNVEVGNTATKSVDFINDYLYPKTATLTLDNTKPFAVDGTQSKAFVNPYTNHVESIDNVLDVQQYGNVAYMIYSYDGSTYFKTVNLVSGSEGTAVELDTSTYDMGVIKKIYSLDSLTLYSAFLVSGTTITSILYDPASGVAKSTVSVNNPNSTTISTIDAIISSETLQVHEAFEIFSHVVIFQFNTSSAIICAYDVGTTTVGGSVLIVAGTSDFNTKAVRCVAPLWIDGAFAISIIDQDDKVYLVNGSEMQADICHDMSLLIEGYDTYTEGDEVVIAGSNVGLTTTLLKHHYSLEKVVATIAHNTLEYQTTLSESGVYGGVRLNIIHYGDIVVEFGYYTGAVWTSLLVNSISGTANTREETSLVLGTIELGTHVRVYGDVGETIEGMFGTLLITSELSGDEGYLYIDGYEVLNGVKVSGNCNFGKVPSVKYEDSESYEISDEINSVRVHGLNRITYAYTYGTDNELGILNDTTQRDGLFGETMPYYPNSVFGCSFDTTDITVMAFAFDYSEFFITTLDSDLLRDDNAQTIEVSVTPVASGLETDDLELDSTSTLIELILIAIPAIPALSVPYAMAMFDCGHVDFQRNDDSTVRNIVSYQSVTTGGTHYYNKQEGVVLPLVGGDLEEVTTSCKYMCDSTEMEVFVESANILFDPTYQGMLASDNVILAYVTRAISSHPTVIDWTSDGNYIMNDFEGVYSTGQVSETSDMDNSVILVSGTKQITVSEVEIDDRSASSVKIKVLVSKTDITDENNVYDDFKVFHIQLSPSGLFGLEGDNDE